MKAKLNLNGAAIKNFFINNGEKIVLGVVVLLLLNFAYGAITAKPIDPEYPNKIKNESAAAIARVNEKPWLPGEGSKPEYAADDYRQKAELGNQPETRVASLEHPSPLDPEIFPPLIKRADPKFLPVMDLTGVGRSALVTYLQDQKEIAAALPDTKALPKRKQREEETKKLREKKGKGAEEGQDGRLSPPGVIPGSRGRRGEDETAQAQLVTDRPVSGAQLPGARGTGMRLEPKFFAVITGLVPFEEQYKEYKKKFEDALGRELSPASSTGGDQYTPQYIYWNIERAEVKDHRDQNFVWKRLDMTVARKDWALWGQTNPQGEPPIDSLYSFSSAGSAATDPYGWAEFLEWPLPPLILRDWGFEVTHPKVPFQKAVDLNQLPDQEFYEPGKEPVNRNPGTNVGPGPRRGVMGPGGMPFGRGRGGMEGEFGPRGRGGHLGGNFGGGMDGTFGAPQAPYKLYRYVDMTCEKGKRYRYRVQLMLNNPNYGFLAGYLERPESAEQQWVLSEWSAPSSVIEIPMNGQVLAAGAGATGASAGESEGNVSILELAHWEKKEDKKKVGAAAAAAADLGGLNMGMVNTEPTEGWVEVLKEGLKLSLGGLAYFSNEKIEKVLDMAVEIEKKRIEGLLLNAQEAMLLDVRNDDLLGGGRSKGPTEMLFFTPDGRLFSATSGVDRLKSEDYKDRTYVPANITGGAFPGGEFGPRGGEFGPRGGEFGPRGGGRLGL